MVTTTRSRPRGASSTVTGLAPVSFANPASVSGPRELAMTTSCPRRVKCPASAEPMFPAPIIPIFIVPFVKIAVFQFPRLNRLWFAEARLRERDLQVAVECGGDNYEADFQPAGVNENGNAVRPRRARLGRHSRGVGS